MNELCAAFAGTPQAQIEHVAQCVTQKVPGEHDDRNCQTGEYTKPGRNFRIRLGSPTTRGREQ